MIPKEISSGSHSSEPAMDVTTVKSNLMEHESPEIVKDVSTDLSTDTSAEGNEHLDQNLDNTLETVDDTVSMDQLWTDDSPVLEDDLNDALNDVLHSTNGDNDEDDDLSKFSDRNDPPKDDDSVSLASMNSTMSAVQLRLENRKRAKQLDTFQSQEDLEAKLAEMTRKIDAATRRRETSLRTVVERASSHHNVVKDVTLRNDQQHEDRVESLQEKHEKKMTLANERKKDLIQEISSKMQLKMEKVSTTKSSHDAETNARAEAIQEKHEMKMTLANERKENLIQGISSKMQTKMTKVSDVISKVEQEHEAKAESVQEKHEMKMALASERKENLIQGISSKIQSQLQKVSSARNVVDAKEEAKIGSIQERHEVKMNLATERKESIIHDISSKIKAKMTKISNIDAKMEAETESSREKNEQKFKQALGRKDSLMQKVSAKAAAYVNSATERGQEAIKNRDSDGNTVTSLESEIRAASSLDFSLASIREDSVLEEQQESSPQERSLFEGNHVDDASVSSTSSNKSQVQIRLEKWERKVPTKDSLQSKLDAAAKRREASLLKTKSKSGFQSKMEKVSNAKESVETALLELKAKVAEKMKSATQRKEALLTGKSTEAFKTKSAKVEALREHKQKQLSSIEKKLGEKLLSAIERKENIIAAKSAKAGKRVSTTSLGGYEAMKKREKIINNIVKKSENKKQSAQQNRKQLRDLEKKKRDVMKLRRDMVLAMKNDINLSKIEEKLQGKMTSAAERKEQILAAKAARASGHLSETSERGQEAMRRREATEMKVRSKSEKRFESAIERKHEILKSELERKEKRILRRERGRAIAKQKRSEQQMIDDWEGRPSMDEGDASIADNDSVQNDVTETYDEVDLEPGADEQSQGDQSVLSSRKFAAKELLMKEIQLANEAKYREMAKITKERKEAAAKPRPVSAASIGSIDTQDAFSFAGEDVSISGLSAVIKEEKSRSEVRRQKAALAIAELDIKLSEIQIMQAIILAEEASVKGEDSFTTVEKIDDLDRVNVSVTLEENGTRKLKKRAQNFFAYAMKRADVAKAMAAKTIQDIKRQAAKVEAINSKKKQETKKNKQNQVFNEVLV